MILGHHFVLNITACIVAWALAWANPSWGALFSVWDFSGVLCGAEEGDPLM